MKPLNHSLQNSKLFENRLNCYWEIAAQAWPNHFVTVARRTSTIALSENAFTFRLKTVGELWCWTRFKLCKKIQRRWELGLWSPKICNTFLEFFKIALVGALIFFLGFILRQLCCEGSAGSCSSIQSCLAPSVIRASDSHFSDTVRVINFS